MRASSLCVSALGDGGADVHTLAPPGTKRGRTPCLILYNCPWRVNESLRGAGSPHVPPLTGAYRRIQGAAADHRDGSVLNYHPGPLGAPTPPQEVNQRKEDADRRPPIPSVAHPGRMVNKDPPGIRASFL